jgi:glutamyl/glutaminyl-tRNA synthetase
MQISHIIRGEDHLSNTPKQILLQEALNFYQPIYAHLPLMLNADKSKMSKRAGDVAVMDYHKNGYLPEALINFMVLLGWNPGTEKEIFSLPELVKEFSLEKVQKAGAVFNLQRLDFINGLYIRQKSPATLVKLCAPFLPEHNLPEKTVEKIIGAYQGRMKKLSDIATLADFFFAEKLSFDKKMLVWKQMGDSDIKEALLLCDSLLGEAKKFDAKSLEGLLVPAAEKFNPKNRGYLLWPLRVALSGKEASAGPFEIAEILGKTNTLQRIGDAINLLT